MQHLRIDVSNYPVWIGDLTESWKSARPSLPQGQPMIVVDDNTHRLCHPLFLQKTGLPPDTPVAVLPAGEIHKNLDSCTLLWKQFLSAGLERSDWVVLLGGGVVGDLGGFATATYKRGLPFVQVPTTLLAATDASVGGKLGVDFAGYKNAVGLFQNPLAVLADPDFFQTLPEREWRSGLAEVIKHGFIADPALLQTLQTLESIPSAPWPRLLAASVAVKVRVVQQDPLERGLRQVLNFGHTIGHALESLRLRTPDPLTHGEAVAVGMYCECQISEKGRGPRTAALGDLLKRFFPAPLILPEEAPEIWRLMQHDKKNAAGKVRMALPAAEAGVLMLEPAYEEVKKAINAFAAAGFEE